MASGALQGGRIAGLAWERVAESFLVKRGLKSRERNFFSRFGEIDLIMEDGSYLVFVEVKYRRHGRFGTAAQMLGPAKQKRLVLAARCFLAYNSQLHKRPCRFDLVAIQGNPEQPEIHWIPSAFTCE